jgi:ketosteroid isomerase-like protein
MNLPLPEADAATAAEVRDWLDGFAACVREVDYAAAMAVAIAPWTSTGFHEDGAPFDRPGRATIALARQPDGRWLGVHSHMSLARGVPQDSHGKRAVKAR